MFQKGLKQCLLALVCCTAVLSSACSTIGLPDPFSEPNREAGWACFKEERPEIEYVEMGKPGMDAACAEITHFYEITTDLLDKTVARVENSEVALTLETVRTEQGEEAYFQALDGLTKKERRQYRRYIKAEINYLELFDTLAKKVQRMQKHIPFIEREVAQLTSKTASRFSSFDLANILEGADEITTVLQSLHVVLYQAEFSIKAINWMLEYRNLLQRALKYKGR